MKKWTITDSIYLFQFVLFWATCVGGLFVTIFSAVKKLPFPVWGVVLVWLVAAGIQVLFLVLFVKTEPIPFEQLSSEETEQSIEDKIQKEFQEIQELNKKRSIRRD